jgi:hypothetical protein
MIFKSGEGVETEGVAGGCGSKRCGLGRGEAEGGSKIWLVRQSDTSLPPQNAERMIEDYGVLVKFEIFIGRGCRVRSN